MDLRKVIVGTLLIGLMTSAIGASGPVAYYPFSGDASDASGNGNNGIIHGAILSVDRFGNSRSSFYFDGSSYIEVPYSSTLSFKSNLTVTAWVKTLDGSGGICHQHNGLGNGNFACGVQNNGHFRFGKSSNVGSGVYDSRVINDDVWHFIVGVFDDANDTVKHYVDNALTLSKYEPNSLPDSPIPMIIGNENYLNYPFQGSIDDIRIYNRALSSFEIDSLFNVPKAFPNPSVTVLSPNTPALKWAAYSKKNIRWAARDTGSLQTRSIYFSKDNKVTWFHVDSGACDTGMGSYSWNVPGSLSNSCWIKINVYNKDNSSASDISDYSFSIVNAAYFTSSDTAQGTAGKPFGYKIAYVIPDTLSHSVNFSCSQKPAWITQNIDTLWGTPVNTGCDTVRMALYIDGQVTDSLILKIRIKAPPTNLQMSIPRERTKMTFSVRGIISPTITYYLPIKGMTRLSVYGIDGTLVQKIFEGEESAGEHSIRWKGNASAGLYLLRLDLAGKTFVQKMMLCR